MIGNRYFFRRPFRQDLHRFFTKLCTEFMGGAQNSDDFEPPSEVSSQLAFPSAFDRARGHTRDHESLGHEVQNDDGE